MEMVRLSYQAAFSLQMNELYRELAVPTERQTQISSQGEM